MHKEDRSIALAILNDAVSAKAGVKAGFRSQDLVVGISNAAFRIGLPITCGVQHVIKAPATLRDNAEASQVRSPKRTAPEIARLVITGLEVVPLGVSAIKRSR